MTYQSTNNLLIYNNMASIYSSLKKYDSALFYFEKGYEINPNDIMIIQNIAVVAYLTNNYSKAIEYANKALSINNGLKKSFGILYSNISRVLDGKIIEPANEEEAKNDYLLSKNAHYKIVWCTNPSKDSLEIQHQKNLEEIYELYTRHRFNR